MNQCNKPLGLCSTTPKQKFWLLDPTELYKNNNYMEFIPTSNMSRHQQLNALTRFFIYLTLLLLIFKKNDKWLYLPLIGLVLILIIYGINTTDTFSNIKEFDRIMDLRLNKLINNDNNADLHHDNKEITGVKVLHEDLNNCNRSNPNLQSGYIDSEGDIILGDKYNVNTCDDPKLYTFDEILDYEKNTCRQPDLANPFMNPNIIDYNNGPIPQAGNVDDDEIKENMRVNFNHNLFRDIDDLWERENSQRQFYTIPNTAIPNHQTEFAEWLYKIPKTCKEDHQQCLRYEDLRFKR